MFHEVELQQMELKIDIKVSDMCMESGLRQGHFSFYCLFNGMTARQLAFIGDSGLLKGSTDLHDLYFLV